MRQYARAWFAGSVGLLIATSAGLSTATGQEAGRPAGAEAAAHTSAGRGTELLITHALDMALDGSELQLIIRQAGGPVMAGTTDAGVTRTGGAAGAAGAGPATTAMGHGGLIQLQHQVRRSFQESHELMKASNRLLRAGGEERAERAAASRLYAATNLYVNTLYSLGRQTFGWQVGWEPVDRSDEGGERPGQTGQRPEANAGHTAIASGAKLKTGEVAMITLINHAVRESLGAFELSQSVQHLDMADPGVHRLREHARTMAAASRQSIEQILAALHEKEGTGASRAQPGGEAAGAGTHEGWGGSQVQALAQQAREVIRVYGELCGEEKGAPGAARSRR